MNNQVHEESLMMEKFTSQDQQQQQRLKCPRCESWNTKFCYYNNYSLSQPRHFCKGCKRYWTSGGTLRNVPVGGGCRKINKRIKKPSTISSTSTNHSSTLTPSISTTNTNPSHHIHQAQNDTISPLLYGLLPTYPSNLKFPFPRLFNNSEICNIDTISGLGFVQDFGTANSSSLSSSNSICGSSTLASLIASNPQQHNFRGLISSYEDLEIPGKNVHSGNGMMSIKMEGDGQNRLVWNLSNHEKIPMEQLNSSDPSLSWTGANLFDPSHMGSSVPSLI